jgi:hypothetical protein
MKNLEKKIWSKLPNELVEKIMVYSCQPQSKKLLSDILHYQLSYDLMIEWYRKSYEPITPFGNMDISKGVFIYDLFDYFNYNVPAKSMNYMDHFVQIWKRFPKVKHENQIEDIVETLLDKNITTQIRVFWGILTITERNDFIYHNGSIAN